MSEKTEVRHRKSEIDHGGPYTACTGGMGPWWVEDHTGWNVLRFKVNEGDGWKNSLGIWTNETQAKKIAEEWNGQQ